MPPRAGSRCWEEAESPRAPAETLPLSKQMKSKLFSTVTAAGGEHGVPSCFNDSGKQQRLRTADVQGRGRGSTAPAPGCAQAGTGPGSWEWVWAAPREAAQGVCRVWWERSGAAGGNQTQAPGSDGRARRGTFQTVTGINAEPTQPCLMPLSRELRSSWHPPHRD